MALDREKIKAEIERPRKRETIRKAIAQQDWIKFHTDTNLDAVTSMPFERFKTFMKSQLPEDKYLASLNNLKFAIPTNMVTESIFTKLAKIFDGRNPAFNYQLHITQERDDLEWYLQ